MRQKTNGVKLNPPYFEELKECWAKHRGRGPLMLDLLFGLLTHCYLPVAALSVLIEGKRKTASS